jgi:hypothetical protein
LQVFAVLKGFGASNLGSDSFRHLQVLLSTEYIQFENLALVVLLVGAYSYKEAGAFHLLVHNKVLVVVNRV